MGVYPGGLATVAWAQFWQVTVVALAVGAVASLVGRRRPHLAYVLWLLVIVKSLMPPLWSSPLGVFSWAGGRVAERPEANVPPPSPALPPPLSAVGPVSAEIAPGPYGNLGPERPERFAAVSDAPKPEPTSVAPAEIERSDSPRRPWSDGISPSALLGIVWLFGAAMYLVVVARRMAAWKSAIRRSRPPGDGPLADLVARVCMRLGMRRKVAVHVSSEPLGPAVVGIVRPMILLPEVLVRDRSSEQLEPIVAHELIHIRRYDSAVGILQVLAQCLWWFHPLVWWSNRAVCRERERCCDAEAVGSLECAPEQYAQGLLNVLRLERPLVRAAGMPGMYPYEITRMRLETLMNPSIRIHCRTPLGYWLVFAAGLLVTLPGAAVIRGAESPARTPPAVHSKAPSVATAVSPSVRPVRTLSGHTAAVRSVAYSPDGKTLASGSVDGTVRLWQLPEARQRAVLKPQARLLVFRGRRSEVEAKQRAALKEQAAGVTGVNAIAFAPDGKLLASAGSDGVVRLWDPATGKQVRAIHGHKGAVFCVAFSPDGKRLASAGADRSIRLWDPASGKPVPGGVFRHGAVVRGIAFGADSKTIASVADGGTLNIFQLSPPELRASLPNWTEVRSIARSPNDQAMAIGLGYGAAITLWARTPKGELQRCVLGGHRYGTNSLAFSPDGKILASAGSDGRIKVWDMNTKRKLAQATADPSAALAVAFSPDGRQLASAGADHRIRLWTVSQLKAIPREKPRFPKVIEPPRSVQLHHAEEPRSVGELKRLGAEFLAKGARPSWSPDATQIVYVTTPDSELHVLDLRTGRIRSLHEIGRDPAWSPKPGRWIAYVRGRQHAEFMGSWPTNPPFTDPPQGDEEIRLIDSSGGQPRRIAEGYAPAWSADAKTLYFISGKDQKVKSVEVKANGSPGAIKDLFGISIHSLLAAISPAGPRVAYLGEGRLVVADREGDKTWPTWPTGHLRTWLLGWSPNGRQLGGTNIAWFGGLLLLDQDTGRAVRLGTGELVAPAWSPDGSMIAFDDHLVDGSEIWMIDAKVLAALSSAPPPYHPKGPAVRFDLRAPFQPKGKLTCVDVQPKADQTMDLSTFDTPFNDMRQVPRGGRNLGGVKFTIGPGSLQLGSGLLPEAPWRIEAIPVGKRVARIYVLHGTQFSGPVNNVADGTTIGWYRVIYDDQTEQPIAVVAGEDVRSWFADDSAPAGRGTKVWEGKNLLTGWADSSVRLFASGWTNPHPEKKIARIDYIAAGTQAAPFCLAITVEEPVSR